MSEQPNSALQSCACPGQPGRQTLLDERLVSGWKKDLASLTTSEQTVTFYKTRWGRFLGGGSTLTGPRAWRRHRLVQGYILCRAHQWYKEKSAIGTGMGLCGKCRVYLAELFRCRGSEVSGLASLSEIRRARQQFCSIRMRNSFNVCRSNRMPSSCMWRLLVGACSRGVHDSSTMDVQLCLLCHNTAVQGQARTKISCTYSQQYVHAITVRCNCLYSSLASTACTIIPLAAPPPLQIAAQPYSPGFS